MSKLKDKIDLALRAPGKPTVMAVANGAVLEELCAEDGVELDATERFATYRGVRVDRSPSLVPGDGFVVNSRY